MAMLEWTAEQIATLFGGAYCLGEGEYFDGEGNVWVDECSPATTTHAVIVTRTTEETGRMIRAIYKIGTLKECESIVADPGPDFHLRAKHYMIREGQEREVELSVGEILGEFFEWFDTWESACEAADVAADAYLDEPVEFADVNDLLAPGGVLVGIDPDPLGNDMFFVVRFSPPGGGQR